MALNFPDHPHVGEVFVNWEWDGRKWINKGHVRSPEEAPHDGITYGRKDEKWEPVLNLEDGGVVEKDLTVEGHFITHGRAELGTQVAAGQVGLEVARKAIFHGEVTVPTPVNGTDAANKDYVDQIVEERKYADQIVGTGSNTSFTVHHGFDTKDVLVNVYDTANDMKVLTDVRAHDPDEVQIQFTTAPHSGKAYRVVVMG